ncbi:cell division protein SepF [Aureibacillus halotolerans]|uniref:Cell division protein SepF n=1 Tax=Aureibacillus halotolerans TaxID=1508390 RepID=A0A4R6U7K6_9BACI|nr:cell division protein SepF [Aureibacillus halotolerans]TDQ42341.1 cell division inhibitor SepF [Aureibacillus halotolerans]
MGFKDKWKQFIGLDDEEYEVYENEGYAQEEEHTATKGKSKQNVVSLQSVQQSSKMVLVEPRMYDEAQDIADHLKNRRTVVINLQRISSDQAKRIVDFLSGTVYALGGDIQKLGPNTFLCTPDNVDVSGAITEMLQTDTDRRNNGW